MSYSLDHSFDESTHNALSQLAQQPGYENLGAPIDDQNRIQLINFAPPQNKTRLTIAVQPSYIHVERADGEPFGIADHSHDSDNPISVLGHAVTSLAVERSENGWTVSQRPNQHLVVDNSESFERFWRVLASYVQDKRTRASQKAAS